MRLLLALVPLLAVSAHALTLADGGGAGVPIVLADDPTPAEQTAAGELADYLGRATGATFEIVPEAAAPDGPAILVGPTALAREQGLVPDGPEAWRMRLVGDRLLLAGGRPRGTLYAVFRFLEDVVGVRWWTPWEEHVPQRPTLAVDALDRGGEPAFSYRDIYDQVPAPKPFSMRNRINGEFTYADAAWGGRMGYGPPYHVHTFYNYVPPDQYFAEHPEYFSLIDGKRRAQRDQLCLTNPDVKRIVIDRLRAWIEESREKAEAAGELPPTVFDISQNDWNNPCQCDECQAVVEREGSEAGVLLEFVNAIADDIRDDYPEVMIDTLAYHYTLDPPRNVKPRDNVIIRLCDLSGSDFSKPLTHPDNQPFHDSVLAWGRIAENLRVWDYAVTYDEHHGLPFPSLRTMPADYRFLHDSGVDGLFIEHEYPVEADLRDLKTWVQAKLLEDPYQDYDALVTDFTDGYYGAAGPRVREYLAALEAAYDARPAYIGSGTSPSGYRFLDLAFVTQAQAIFDAAAAAVADDPVLARRVRHARLPLDRATVLRWSLLCREHAQAGGTAATMPLNAEDDVVPRIRQTVAEQAELRLQGAQRERIVAALTGDIDAYASMNAFLPLPERFRDVARERVTDITPEAFRRWKSIAKVVEDPASEVGVAARLRLDDPAVEQPEKYRFTAEAPMPWGVYDTRARKGITSAPIKPADVPGPGYHWYHLDNVALTPGSYLYFWWSWILQVDLDLALGDAEQRPVDVWASMKFEGPWFPHGEADAENAISVDRVIVVARE